MKATFDGQDYMLMLDKKAQELRQLRKGQRLDAQLTSSSFEGEDLGKLVSLEFGQTNATDGIEVNYSPEDPESWEAIKEVRVKINESAYGHIAQRGQFGTRYNGSDKIEIFDGDPREI